MKAEKDKVVYFHYQLSEVGKEPLERSDEKEPSTFLYGHHNILPALEKAMAGLESGQKCTVTLSPEEAYGERQEGREQRVPIKHLLNKGKLRPGMAVKINTQQGPKDATVLKVGKFNVDVDTNHPLAGLSLTFDIDVVDVRDATPEELAHGHVHGVGGHHH